MGFKSFFNYKEDEKEKQADSSNTEKGEENRDNNDSEKTGKDEVGPNKIDDKANENDKDGEHDEQQNESSSKGSPKKRNGQGKRKKNNETNKEDNKVEEDSNKKGSKKRAKCNIPIEEDSKENDNNKDESVKEEVPCNDETNDAGSKHEEKDVTNESEKTNVQDKNQTVSNTTPMAENNNINLENYRNYQYYYNQYYSNINNLQSMGNDIGSGYNSNISKENFQNKKNNLNNNINTYPEFNNFNNMYMPIGMNNYYNMYNYNYINGYANIGNAVGVNNYNYNYYYGGNVETNGMYDYSKDLVSSGGGDMKNYAFLSLINRSLELMKTSDKVKEILKSPARLQVTQEELNKVEHTQDNQNSNNNTVWFGKYVTDKNNNNNPKFVAKYKCNPSKDSGYTKADKSYANKPYFCIYFARGCCAYGHNCLYRHRVPTENDELEYENTMDIFGREKYNTFKEDMSGNGNFNNDCRTLFIGSIYINHFNEVSAIEKALYDEFVIYGNIDYVRFIPNKNIAFIQFTNRVNAEFARVAMSDQPLGNYSISLTIKWAFDMKPQPAGNPTNYYNGMNNANPYFYNPNQAMSSTWPQYMSQNSYDTSSNVNYYDQANNLASPTIGPANFPPNFTANKGKAPIGPAPAAPAAPTVPAAPATPAAPAHPPPSNNNDAQNGKKKKSL
ncbi:pre-mRNA-splicing factor CWC2, putative [Plasmodium vinckei]|uniref:Pre-mRNA-splicing factor CWC2, putative n=1 Tax=Plasmodium vinckei TaxID=5860 RepID=A0A6V7T4S8_PLAVN|nr:pre-mRNA-splicing factor CWC2, putative [Plasmodium vinckei]